MGGRGKSTLAAFARLMTLLMGTTWYLRFFHLYLLDPLWCTVMLGTLCYPPLPQEVPLPPVQIAAVPPPPWAVVQGAWVRVAVPVYFEWSRPPLVILHLSASYLG